MIVLIERIINDNSVNTIFADADSFVSITFFLVSRFNF
jgi:hypothetical protein